MTKPPVLSPTDTDQEAVWFEAAAAAVTKSGADEGLLLRARDYLAAYADIFSGLPMWPLPAAEFIHFGAAFNVVAGQEATINAAILAQLMFGANGLALNVAADMPIDWRALLSGVDLSLISLKISGGHVGFDPDISPKNLFTDSHILCGVFSGGIFAAQNYAQSALIAVMAADFLAKWKLNPDQSWAIHWPIGQDMIGELAAITALRLVMGKITNAINISPKMAIIGVGKASNRGEKSPNNNAIRAGNVAMIALLARLDGVICPIATAGAGAQERRLAGLTSLILADEAGLGKADIMSGTKSVGHVGLTIAQEAWGLFQEIEKSGSLASYLTQNGAANWASTAPSLPKVGEDIFISELPIPNSQHPKGDGQ